MRIISATSIKKLRARFPTLDEFGLMDDDMAVAILAADKLGCRPCDIQKVQQRRDGSVAVERIR